MKTEILRTCDQLVSAGLNGVGQGIIVALLVALCLRLLPRTNAATRHAIWFCTMLILVGLVVANGVRETKSQGLIADESPAAFAGQVPRESTGVELSAAKPTPTASLGRGVDRDWVGWMHEPPYVAVVKSQSDASTRNSVGNSERCDHSSSDPFCIGGALDCAGLESSGGPIGPPMEESKAAPPPARTKAAEGPTFAQFLAQALAASSMGTAENPVVAGDGNGPAALLRVADSLLNPVSWNLPLGPNGPGLFSVILLGCCLAFAGLRICVLTFRLRGIRARKRAALPPSEALQEFFENLRSRHAPNRHVGVKVSLALESPVVLGFLHPVILLPEDIIGEEIEQVLSHELAHVQRWDDWANLAQHVIQAVFFFHPAIWWIGRRLALEREIACDDHVLQQSVRPRTYALLLANLAGRVSGRAPLLTPGASTNKSQLKQRIDMILNTKRNASPRLAGTRLGFITSAAVLLALAAIYAAPRVVLAQSETAGSAASAPPAPGSVDVAPVLAAGAAIPDEDSDPTALPGVSSGPKLKTITSIRTTIPSVTVAASAAPVAPPAPAVIATLPTAPPVFAAADPGSLPRTPRPPRLARASSPRSEDSSLEARLDRLEKMVESLVAQQSMKPGQFAYKLQAPEVMISRQEIDRIRESAQQEAKAAVEQSRRAMRDADKAMRADMEHKFNFKFKEGSQKQLEALRKQVEVLEREREKLDREIEQLERDQEKLQDDGQNEKEKQHEKSKAEKAAQDANRK